jgi:hypothetical protein
MSAPHSFVPFPQQPDPVIAVRQLRLALWLSPFIGDSTARVRLLALAEAIEAELDPPAIDIRALAAWKERA